MAIELRNFIPSSVLSRNQIPAVFDCPDVINTEGAQESITVNMNFNPQNDDVLEFEWSYNGVTYTATFTFKDSPDADLYEIETGTTNSSYILYTVIPGLLSHPDLFEFFDFELWEDAPSEGFTLTARSQYTGPLSLQITIEGNPIATESTTTGVAPVIETDYLASVWLNISPAYNSELWDYQRIGELELFPDNDNRADIDLAGLLDAHFTTPETPTDTTGAAVVCTELTRKFYLAFGQKFGDPVERKKQFISGPYTVCKGGVRHLDFPDYDLGDEFLTIRTVRYVDAEQKDWLVWHHQYKGSMWDVALRADIYYTDGAQSSQNLWVDTGQTMQFGYTYQMQAGLVESGIKAIADGVSKTVAYYDLYLVAKDPGSASIEAVTNAGYKVRFIIKSPDSLTVYFLYENTVGGHESWAMIGSRVYKGSKTSNEYRRPLLANKESDITPANAAATFQELISFNEQDQPALQFNTGPMSQTDALAFPDFLRSRHKYIKVGSDWVPFRIPDTEYQVDQENIQADYTREQTFTALLAPSKGVSNLKSLWT